jgi:hypothetical protein
VVGEWIRHRALVAVVGGQVKDVSAVLRQRREDLVVVDRALHEAHASVVREVLALGGQEVVDDDDLDRAARKERPDQVGADEAGPADDEDPVPPQRVLAHSPTLRCV